MVKTDRQMDQELANFIEEAATSKAINKELLAEERSDAQAAKAFSDQVREENSIANVRREWKALIKDSKNW